MSWPVALMWGTVIVAVVLGVLAAAYLLIQTFVLRLPAIPISHQQDPYFVSGASFPLGPARKCSFD